MNDLNLYTLGGWVFCLFFTIAKAHNIAQTKMSVVPKHNGLGTWSRLVALKLNLPTLFGLADTCVPPSPSPLGVSNNMEIGKDSLLLGVVLWLCSAGFEQQERAAQAQCICSWNIPLLIALHMENVETQTFKRYIFSKNF